MGAVRVAGHVDGRGQRQLCHARSYVRGVRRGAFFFSSRRRHTRWNCDWSSDVCSSDLRKQKLPKRFPATTPADGHRLPRRWWPPGPSARLPKTWRSTATVSCSSPCTRTIDRKSTRLNSSHSSISYAVFCLKKKDTRTSAPSRLRKGDRNTAANTEICAGSSGFTEPDTQPFRTLRRRSSSSCRS